MRQEVTRMHKGWSLDTVTIDNHVLRSYKDDIRESPTEVTNSYNSPTSFSLF
jgi:dynein heavy chain